MVHGKPSVFWNTYYRHWGVVLHHANTYTYDYTWRFTWGAAITAALDWCRGDVPNIWPVHPVRRDAPEA